MTLQFSGNFLVSGLRIKDLGFRVSSILFWCIR